MKVTSALTIALSIAAVAFAAKPKDLLEVERFQDLKISPDGTLTAGKFQRDDGRIRLMIRDMTKHDNIYVGPHNVAQGQWGEKSVENYVWVNNDYIAATAVWDDGVKGLHTIKVSGAKDGDTMNTLDDKHANAIVDPIPGSSKFIVAQKSPKNEYAPCRVLLLDANDRQFENVLYETESKAFEAITDRKNELRLVKKQESESAELAWFARDPESNTWKRLKLNPWLKVFGFDANPDRILVSGSFSDSPPGIYYYSISEDKAVQKLLVHEELPMHKIATPVFNPSNGLLVGAHVDSINPISQWIDPSLKLIQKNIDTACKDSFNRILSWDDTRKRVLAERTYQDKPTSYYAFDFKSGVMDFVCLNGGVIKENDAASSKRVEIPNRDGTMLGGFLTKSKKAKKNAPILVIVRNNPFATLDTIGWKNDDQYYASLGYVVLRLNFSGSGEMRGPLALDWKNPAAPLKPIQDLEDALKWADSLSHGDSSNAAIIGYGAGGWIATYSTIASPKLFKCAVSTAGVYDLVEYQNKDAESPISNVAPHVFAEPSNGLSKETLAKLSPMQNASKITAALMLSYGNWDGEGYKAHVKEFAKVAADAGVTVDKVYKGGWWGSNIENNQQFYEFNLKIAAFLKKNM